MTAVRSDDPQHGHRPRWRRGGLLLAAAASVLMAGCSVAGSLDTSYSGDGVATYQDQTGEARTSVQQPDGKTIVAGWGYFPDNSPSLRAVYVARYDTTGTADPSFGSGMAKVDVVSGAEVVRSVAVDGQGRVVVVGTVPAADYPDDSDVFVIRLTAAGQPDPTFDGDGILLIDRTNHDRAGDIVASGSRLLLAGSFDADGSWANQWTVLALNQSGALDTTFSGDGVAPVPTAKVSEFDRLRSLAVQPDGKLVLGGTASNEFVAARLLADGTLDASWDGDGVARTLVGTGGEAQNVLVQPDGKVALAGYARANGRSDEDMAVVRWTGTGALDTGFDGDGKVFVDFGRQENDRAYGAALDGNSRVVLGGFAYTATGMDLAVARLTTAGTPDPAFSGDGRTTTNFGETANEEIESVTMGSNGRILGAGWYHDRWLIAAYTS
jgi:uncharacterized delta-60 repeat protein